MLPLSRQDFARYTPASNVGRAHDRFEIFRKVLEYRLGLGPVEEPRPGVALMEHRHIWNLGDFARLHAEPEHRFEGRQFAVDGGVRRAGFEPAFDV